MPLPKVAVPERVPRDGSLPHALAYWERAGTIFPMKAVIDAVGRVVVPKQLRDALGLQPGSEVEISRYGAGLQLIPA